MDSTRDQLSVQKNADDSNSSDESEIESSYGRNEACSAHSHDRTQSSQLTNIGHITLNQANDVTIGNKIIYNGPIIIHQHVEERSKPETRGRNYEDVLSEMLNRTVVSQLGSPRIVTREEWFARPPAREPNRLKLPAIRVIIAYTCGKNATTQSVICEMVRNFQAEHIEMKGWDDIGYNFLVGGDGSIYEGRGWDHEGAHSRIYNKRSICIAFIGSYYENCPPQRSLIAAQQMIEQGVKLNKLAVDYRLYGHRQLIPTVSPGNKIYNIIRTWNHWTEDVIPP